MTSTPGLRSGRIIVNEVTFLKSYVPLTAGWTEALVILIEKRKAKKRSAGRMQRAGLTMVGEKEGVGETAWGQKGKRSKKAGAQRKAGELGGVKEPSGGRQTDTDTHTATW